MAIDKPYRRTCRQFIDGSYTKGGKSRYILDPRYAKSPEQYVRAYLILLKDIQNLFDFIEPSDKNSECYSYRIHELLLRSCVEVEANCKAILQENGYTKKRKIDMRDYRKINETHHLSSYKICLPTWHGKANIREPFLMWAGDGKALPWYETYNTTKHNRHEAFESATFNHMIDSVCGLSILLSSQFHTEDFSGTSYRITTEGPGDGMKSAIGGYFRILFPDNWTPEHQYDFDWQILKDELDPFQDFDYSKILP